MATNTILQNAPVTGLTGAEWVPISLNSSTADQRAQVSMFNVSSGSVAQSANVVFAGPTSGAAANPTWRALVIADLPGGSVAGEILQSAASGAPSYTATPTLGASGTLGTLTFGNATSGLLTIAPATGALSSGTLTMPNVTADTIAALAATQTLTHKTFGDSVLCNSSAGGGIGYNTGQGAGSTVSQATNKTTAFTLSKITGQITFAAGSLASVTAAVSTWTNTTIGPTDTIEFSHISGGTFGAYVFIAQPTQPSGGSASLAIINVTGGSLNEQPVVQFNVIKGAIT